MIKAVLFDLDDTLLRLSPQFLPTYMTGVGQAVAALSTKNPVTPEKVSEAMRTAVRAMVENLDPTRINREVFNECLAIQFDLPPSTVKAAFDQFHGGAYLDMQALIQPLPGASALLKRLLDSGYIVVVATNPYFPLRQIQLRMEWAGIDPGLPLAPVTHSEESHFTKPNPHYYEEILARIGVESDEAIMVGDIFANDITPAVKVGMYTFWIDERGEQPDPGVRIQGRGTLSDFIALVEDGWLERLKQTVLPPLTEAHIPPRMIGDTGALIALVESASPAFWHKFPLPGEWSPLEVLCHLRDSEALVQRPRLERIVQEHNPFLEPPPPPPGPGERDLSGEDALRAAQTFWVERQRTLAFLGALPLEAWTKPARHSIFGPTNLLEMALFTTRHDRLHISQLCQTLGRCKES
ncbi:MAG: HAD-IA family hydrolase [Anaerolineae bacterium]|nr:HAD-IA family hydrolase [Anaerolineae bacterium]